MNEIVRIFLVLKIFENFDNSLKTLKFSFYKKLAVFFTYFIIIHYFIFIIIYYIIIQLFYYYTDF